MAKKTVNFTVTAASDEKCFEALKALETLVTKLPHDDLLLLADTASKKPNFVSKAKQYLKYL